jgi:hypothetical protein
MSFRPQGEIFDLKAKQDLPEIFDLQWLFKAEPGRFLLVPANVSRSAKRPIKEVEKRVRFMLFAVYKPIFKGV